MILPQTTLSGKYRLGARRPDGRLRPLTDWFDNLVLDQGLELIATSNTYLDAVQVGTGSVPAVATQTALVSAAAGTANRIAANSAAANAEPWRGFSQITYRFGVGEVTGILREVGIGSSATPGSPLFSRTLITDPLGGTTGVEVLADEALEVEYELSVYAPENDTVGTITIDGVATAYTARAALASTGSVWAPYRGSSFASSGQAVQASFSSSTGSHIAAFTGAIGSITSQPGGTSANAETIADSGYTANSHRRDVRLGWGLNAANFDVRSFLIQMKAASGSGGNSLGAFQVEISPVKTKTSLLELFATFGIGWSR